MDLKLRVGSQQDCQVAEDETPETLREPGQFPGSFCWNLIIIRSIKANPSKDGDAKPWVLSCLFVRNKIARLPKAIHNFSLSAFIEVEKTMTLNARAHRTHLNLSFLLAILACLLFNPAPAFALGHGEDGLPTFAEFSASVKNNQSGVLTGVYVSDVLALPIIQQPAGKAGYVSPFDGQTTQFGMASQFGNIGLLAHNNLSGRFFSELSVGQEVRLVYGDGKVEYFVVSQILQFQALQPTSPYSSFRDLITDKTLTAEQLFKKVYTGDRHVTFQTCIAKPESLSWGRLFVIATPKVLSHKPLYP